MKEYQGHLQVSLHLTNPNVAAIKPKSEGGQAIQVNLVLANKLNHAGSYTKSAHEVSTAGQELASLIKIHIGSSCAIEVVEPETLERSMGKLKRIYDMRNL